MNYTTSDTKKDKIVALVTTLVIHAILIFLLMWFVVGLPDPPLIGTEGMVVNLGYVDESTGDIQPMSENETQPIVTHKEMQQSAESQDKIVTQSIEETQSVKTSEKASQEKIENKTTSPTENTEEPEEQPKVNANALYKGKPNNSTSQGNSNKGTGDQGDPNGDPNAKNYGVNTGTGNIAGGGGKGNGPVHTLVNRKADLTKPQYDCEEQSPVAIVVVEITVDQEGNVTKAVAGARGSTTTNNCLYNKAKEAALKTKFNASDDAPEKQQGTIIYKFVKY